MSTPFYYEFSFIIWCRLRLFTYLISVCSKRLCFCLWFFLNYVGIGTNGFNFSFCLLLSIFRICADWISLWFLCGHFLYNFFYNNLLNWHLLYNLSYFTTTVTLNRNWNFFYHFSNDFFFNRNFFYYLFNNFFYLYSNFFLLLRFFRFW